MLEDRRERTPRERLSPSTREVATVRCPHCKSDVPQDALAAKCGKCATVHHASCFDEKGGCSVEGCGGKSAHVVKGWRPALGECRACSAKIYLDENVAVCAACESHHHPACLEARNGCAECGSGEGMLVLASALQAGKGGSLLLVLFAPLLLGALGSIALALSGFRGAWLPVLAGACLMWFSSTLASRLARRRARRVLDAAEKVSRRQPAAEEEASGTPERKTELGP